MSIGDQFVFFMLTWMRLDAQQINESSLCPRVCWIHGSGMFHCCVCLVVVFAGFLDSISVLLAVPSSPKKRIKASGESFPLPEV